MPAGHRHATDRVDGRAVAECPNGCQVLNVEYSHAVATADILDELRALAETCAHCGTEMDHFVYEEPSEVLD